MSTPTSPCTVCTAFLAPETDSLRSFRPRPYFPTTTTHALAFRDAKFKVYNHRGPESPLAPSINSHYQDHSEIAAMPGDDTHFALRAPAAVPAYEYEAAIRTFLGEFQGCLMAIAVLLLVFLGLGYLRWLLEYLVGMALVGLGNVVLFLFLQDWLEGEADSVF
ncbi:uncharacterized protein L3040_004614 [Drepanopeziza brunnea f. sp. 'multigermtubi']|uniref:Uncharacterized protein n=1 Tax=Marssonina brunnea f. sp. multigermtubi (strain MB_m1) TaxID=1072389 RepID=K1WTL8_MARBU|nr:uncharacterized protein MBM_00108 [Drepanopeziza brunnea f. sp. 'multigermtubi' MB_m1]EKD20995.1 hypothetical protein MBM_00108 [Drepanopeziza brunnea f. sp. 'multigermtubi' MB_m1]KAJ5042055.1 hypothetical protein L3040_004614 [Drepanopeziza brunnea f. sp. 'multigermtubi']